MLKNLPLTYLLLFAGSFIFSLLINSLLLKFARTLGIRNNPEIQIRWSATVKPALGGISFYLIFLIIFLLSEFLISEPVGNINTQYLIGFLCALTVAFLLGLSDDAFDTKPMIKLSAQVMCAIVLIVSGIKINCFESEFVNYALTTFWVVAIMNSYNMLDNMDAIASLTAIAIISFFIFADFELNHSPTIFSLIFIGILACLIAFLFFNWHPSKMFMGDTGSQFIGALLAVGGIKYCWNFPLRLTNEGLNYFPLKNLTLIYLTFLLPISDTAIVFLNRSISGNSPFIGGKDHTTHHLFFKGFSENKIAILVIVLCLIGVILAIQVAQTATLFYTNYFYFLIYPLTISISLYLITVIKKRK
jgi:UDP-GlcNAc:undecaprenyl-phosphate/decaprenyl-phosphate GlcNAc-1-phosphate transferase